MKRINPILDEAQKISRPWEDRKSISDILEFVGDANFVLLGEMSHGTHEFYRIRAEISEELIRQKNFCAIAVEADWPDALRVNRYIKNRSQDSTASEALSDFKRFPQWMWRNADVLDLVGWLRDYNDELPAGKEKIGFYGLDLYSLHSSIAEVLQYLSKVDPDAAKRAHYRYSCFDHFGEDPQTYGYATNFHLSASCQDEVIAELIELRRRAAQYAQMDGRVASDEYFFAEQNARVIKNAERYYREMFRSRVSSWNLRDKHMMETLQELRRYLSSLEITPKIIVWAHNSHIGDARATQMGRSGELNIGQLVREKYGAEAVLIGFSTYNGTVTAASEWNAPAERKRVRPSLPDSYEAVFHQLGREGVLLLLKEERKELEVLMNARLERAIGVIYLPQTERVSHYFDAILPEQFDALIHIDETRAVEPLEPTPEWIEGELPETYPTGL